MQLVFLLEQVVNGLVLGGYYLLLALGLSLIFSVGGVVNLAHGAFYAIGAYVSLEVIKRFGFGPSIVVTPLIVGMIGILFERLLLRRFYKSDPILSLLVTFGLAMVVEQGLRMLWGAAPLPSNMPAELKGNVILGEFLFSKYRLFILGFVFVVMTGIWVLLNKTSFGLVVKAGVQKPDMLAVLGVRLQPYMTSIVALGVSTAALGGTEIMTVAFVVVVIGGLGSFWGVVLAAILVGVVRGITIHFQPTAGEASMYILMFVVLMLFPRGLLGERIERLE
jgi:branched-chain amino acid transport system permease protein